MNIRLISFTDRGARLANRLAEGLSGTAMRCGQPLSLDDWTKEGFSAADALIFVGAVGIAVRAIAPYVRSKLHDPAVVVVDETGAFAVSLLSGHLGGANDVTRQVAKLCGAVPVITTATDVNGKFAVDEFAARAGCAISDMQLAKAFAAGILERDLPLCSAFPIVSPLPGGVYEAGSGALGVYIGCDVREPFEKTLRLIPKKLRVGLGCRRGVCASAITSAIRHVFAENRLDLRAISGVFSIDLKKDEPGLLQACRENGWEASFYPAQTL